MAAVPRMYLVMSRFFELVSSKGEKTFIPSEQLISVESSADEKQGKVILTFRDHPFVDDTLRVVVRTAKGKEKRVANRFRSVGATPIVLNLETSGVREISFPAVQGG
jgi:hypothetical protein